MTPTKEKIIERAFEQYHKDNPHVLTNPEEHELEESGYLWSARLELMRKDNRYKSYASQFDDLEDKTDFPKDLTNFPIETIMKEGCFVCGGRGSGKSNLGKVLVSQALACKIQVKVIDASLAWKKFPLPRIRVIPNVSIACMLNAIYDLSRLSVLGMREFVKAMMDKDLKNAIETTDLGLSFPLLYVLEECQNLVLPNTLRTLKYQAISRFCTQGRNFNASYLATAQRLASVDTNLVEISGVKYWFRQSGENSLRKARAWLDKYHVWRLRDLEVGTCYQQIGSDVEFIRVPLFETMVYQSSNRKTESLRE